MEAAVPWRVRDAGLLLLLGVVTLALGVLGVQGLYRLQGVPQSLPAQAPAVGVALAPDLVYGGILLGVWLLVVRRYHTSMAVLGLRLPQWNALPIVAALCAILIAGSAVVMVGAAWLLRTEGHGQTVLFNGSVPRPTDPVFVPVILGAVLLAPVAEEILFRGILYQSLRRRGAVVATAVSAMAFAALHAGDAIVPAFLLLGVILGVLFEQTGSLYPAMVVHAAYNATILILIAYGV